MYQKIVFFVCLATGFLLQGCVPVPAAPSPTPDRSGFSEAEYATLISLEQLDAYPLYVLHFQGDFPAPKSLSTRDRWLKLSVPVSTTWGCSLFASLGAEGDRLYGRNFDWGFSPTLLLYLDPPGAFSSVSMVDIDYLGFSGDQSKKLMDLPFEQRRALLEAPYLPFDGLNEKGLAIGMAAVPSGEMTPDPQKATIDQLLVMREILDHAATVEEAVLILQSYNVEMSEVPIHYLIASVSGNSALVEFYRGEMVVIRNEKPWQLATNFLVASTSGHPAGACPRYDRLNERLQETNGQLTPPAALNLLSEVAQKNTQWSVVYNLTRQEVKIVMGGDFTGKIHTLNLYQP